MIESRDLGSSYAVRSRRVLLDKGEPQAATLLIQGERIERVLPYETSHPTLLDVENQLIMPGIVDTHAHINEPGRTEWEGFQSATRAAAAGGITSVIDMPLNSIPATTSLEALEIKRASADGKCAIDYGFWGGVVPGNASALLQMIQAGALGFKAFLCESGVDEFPMSIEGDLREAMPILARAGIPLLVHAEIEGARAAAMPSPARSYDDYLRSRPPEWELEAIRLMIRLARETGCRVHIVHLSAADALEEISHARAQGIPITCETCPHYLVFEAEAIHDGATQFKCAPPIREHRNRERLWQGVREGMIDFIVSDHSPCTTGLKLVESGDFSRAWGGIAGLQFSLPAVWTEMSARGFSLRALSDKMSVATARFAGLGDRKGRLAPGLDADFVIWNPEEAFVVEQSGIFHKNKFTPYDGRRMLGRVHKTFVRGQCVYDDGHFPRSNWGQPVKTGEA